MHLVTKKLFVSLLFCLVTCLFSTLAQAVTTTKNQILYLTQSGEIEQAVKLYGQWREKNQAHDFTLLRDIAESLLMQGAQSSDEKSQLISMYGIGTAGLRHAPDLYRHAFSSQNPTLQLATVQFLAQNGEDRAEEVLLTAFSSPFLLVRMEAAHALARRKSDRATSVIENLMHKLPPFLQMYFPELFALIGSADALHILQRLVRSPLLPQRLAAISVAAHFGFDGFLPAIRSAATHPDAAEQEACAAALGLLNDSHSIPTLTHLAQSPAPGVALAACYALSRLGKSSFRSPIMTYAKNNKNPFALYLLGSIPQTKAILKDFLKERDVNLQLNAALALLKKRDPACLTPLLKLLVNRDNHLGCQPVHSLGGTLTFWKVVPSSFAYAKKVQRDIPAMTLLLREHILQEMIELPETAFLSLAQTLFAVKQRDLIPLLVRLLENLNSPRACALLKQQSERVGSPFIRNYCHLALYRMGKGEEHATALFAWMNQQKACPLFRFRPPLSWTERGSYQREYNQLTPEETSRLVLETFEALASHHDPKSLDLILGSMQFGHEKNRYALAGLLLKVLQ